MSTDLNVLIIGHSHAYWMEKFVDASGLFANFEKRGHKCKISFLGIRGATDSSFRGAGGMARIRQHSPQIVLVMLGGNDICSRSSCSPHLVASGLCLLATELLAIGVQQVGICQIEHRGNWRQCSVEEGTARADSVNVKWDAECHGSTSQFYWHHKSLWTSPVQVFRADQVHYNDVGNIRLYRSIRGGEGRSLTFSPLYRPVPPALGSPFLRLKPPS